LPLTRGTHLGSYEIIAAIGFGGMCEVYRARDRRLNRDVAVKVLPPDLHEDEAERERFTREARAVAAINHPGIVTIHSIEEASGLQFLTMELVEGRTLGDLIPETGWPVDRVLQIAIPLADAIGAAHRRGIAHRDLKPSNIMVTADDRVKVLDFGLAKLLKPAQPGATSRSNRTLTADGQILGTIAYMSPEQAEGKPSDRRSDIFSLGIVLYEIASGERPFRGDTPLAVLAAVAEEDPRPLYEIKPELPLDLWRIVRRCLMKDPERRYQSATDLREDLERLARLAEPGDSRGAATDRSSPSRWPGLLAPVSAAAVLGFLLAFWLRPGVESRPTDLPATHAQLTTMEGLERFPAVSPNGQWIAYVTAAAGNDDIYLQSASGDAPVNLTRDNPANDTMPAFSPDGESIAFRSERDGGGLFVMRRTGEATRRVTTGGFYPSWLPDGDEIAFSTQGPEEPVERRSFSELRVVSAVGGRPRALETGDAVQPRISPHALRVAYWGFPATKGTKTLSGGNSDIWTADLNGAHAVRATDDDAEDWNPTWSSDGRWLFFLSNRAGSMHLWRIAIDERTGITRGDPQPIPTPVPSLAHFSLSSDGRFGAYASIVSTRDVARIAFNAASGTVTGPVKPITSALHDIRAFDVTADGRSLVVATGRIAGREDLYVVSTDNGSTRRLTDDVARDRFPVWAHNGERVLFYSDRGGAFDLWTIDADGRGLRSLAKSRLLMPIPSRDGAYVAAGDHQLVVYDARDASRPVEILPPLPDPAVLPQSANDWPSDGRLISISAAGAVEVWLYSRGQRSYRRLADGAAPAWTVDGRRRVAERQGRLVIFDTASGEGKEILAVTGESLESPLLSGDNSQLFFARSTAKGDIWTVRFDDTSHARK
jgi:eukaryotic-like serine/threonine-protein kinase